MSSLENHTNYNCEVETAQGKTYQIYANWMHNTHRDSWQGWQCSAGATRLYIDKDLMVHSGMCLNDTLGSALDKFDLLDHTICRQATCTGCTDDLVISKHKL